MVVENNGIEKMYSFYVSEYHLEMILLPFINKKIEDDKKVVIKTEYDLEESLKVVLDKTNIKKENKEKILNLGWNSNSTANIEDKSNVIIIGDKNYIENTNDKIISEKLDELTIVDCYKFDELNGNINEIDDKYDGNLNTYGAKNF